MTDCYIYTRVSTSKQVTEGNGLDSQLRRCLNYAKDNNYNVIKIYKEEGISGQTLVRPQLEVLFRDLKENKKEKILLVNSSSWLSRNLEHNLTYIGRFTKLKTKLVTTDITMPEGIGGELFRNILTSLNQFEAQSNQLRVFHRMHAQMENGSYVFNPPFGYERNVDKES